MFHLCFRVVCQIQWVKKFLSQIAPPFGSQCNYWVQISAAGNSSYSVFSKGHSSSVPRGDLLANFGQSAFHWFWDLCIRKLKTFSISTQLWRGRVRKSEWNEIENKRYSKKKNHSLSKINDNETASYIYWPQLKARMK